MKNLIFTLATCCFCYWINTGFISPSSEIPKDGITFHQVNLVCGAASDIGCGSRSKPILLDLEKEESIQEAWLNRAGTIVAVVWNNDIEPEVKIVPTIFKKHGKSMETLEGNAYQEQLASFKKDKWYRGTEVDELSMEEAGRIASQFVDPLVNGGILSEEDAAKMHADVEAYIQNEFMTLEDVNLLNTRAYYDGWAKEIIKIGEGYVGVGNMPEIEMQSPSNSSCEKDSKSCCSKTSQKACSSKTE